MAVFVPSVTFVPPAVTLVTLPAPSVIVLPPAVRVLFLPVGVPVESVSTTLTPALLTVVSPVLTLPSLPKSMFFASWTVSLSVPSATTPILPVVSFVASVSPPTTLTVCPRSRWTLAPLSPAKFKPALVVPAPILST